MTEKAGSRRGMVVGALVALVLAAFIAVMRQRSVPDLIVQSDEGWAGEIRVAIAGEVIAPGTYTLHGDARLADVIAAAGGYTDIAARDVLNPAARVSDGQAYTIPMQPTPAPRAATATARATNNTAPLTSPTHSPSQMHPTAPTPSAMVSTESAGDIRPPEATPTGSASASTSLGALADIAAYVLPEVETLGNSPGTPEAPGTPRATRTPRAPRAPRPPALPHAAPAVHATSTSRPTSTPHLPRTATTVHATIAKPTTAAKTAPTPVAKMAPVASASPVKKASINTAPREEFASLPHVSSDLARRITIDRAAHGPYRRVGDLARVPGISRRTLEELRDALTTE